MTAALADDLKSVALKGANQLPRRDGREPIHAVKLTYASSAGTGTSSPSAFRSAR